MEDRKLSREQIALSILNGLSPTLGLASEYYTSNDQAKREACQMVFQMADIFIQERDKA